MESDLDRWDRTNNILAEVMEETERQFEKWGEQNHPQTSPEDPTGIYLLGRTFGAFEQIAKAHFARGERSWGLIELEEVFEWLAAKTPEDRRAELIQVAAVAVSAIASMDRGDGIGPEGPPITDDVSRGPSFTDVFLPGDGSVMVNGEPVTPEQIDANYAKDLVEDDRHQHTFDRLHGLCRCGEAKGS